jgi:hypothetical protein
MTIELVMNHYILSNGFLFESIHTFMIYFIGPVRTAGVRKTNVLSIYRYMHLCTNDIIHLLFEAENFAHSFCIIKYIYAG